MPSIFNNDLTPTLWGSQGNTNPIGSAANISNVPQAGGNANTVQFNNSGQLDGIPFATYANGNLILGSVANLKITGANAADYLTTDGTGNLFWANIQGNTIPRYDWDVTVTGNNQTFSNVNIAKYSSNAYASVFRNGVLVDTSNFTISGPDITFTVPLTTGDKMSLISAATGGPGFASGSTYDVQFNIGGALRGNSDFNYQDTFGILSAPNVVIGSNLTVGASVLADAANIQTQLNTQNLTATGQVHLGPVANVHITGGTNGYVLSTDGLGNLGWVAQTGGNAGNGVPGGSNGQIQFNDGGVFGGEAAFTYNKDTNTLTAGNIVGNGAALTSLTAANIVGTVANATYAATAGAVSGTVAGANVTGQVGFAAVANSVAGGNVSGQVAYAAVANSVAGSNVTGAVGFATVANSVAGANVTGSVPYANIANSVSGSNVSGAVANAAYANLAGNAVSVAGANVTGQVTYAAIANSVAAANVTGTVTYSLNANAANYVTANAQLAINTLGPLTGLTVNGITSLGSNSNVIIQGGAAGSVLTTNGSGNLYWSSGSTGGGTPGGAIGQLQFNNLGIFGGVPNVTFTNGNLSLGAVANVKLTGGTSGQVLSTDGAGNLAWVSGGGGGGSGTVTSVGLTAGTGVAVSGGPITSFGDITVTNTGVTALTAGANIGVSAANGNVTITNNGIRNILAGSSNVSVQIVNGVAVIDSAGGGGGGGVSSVGITAGGGISVIGGPITSSGNITVTNTGVTRTQAGGGIAVDATTGNITVTNTGVTSLTASTGISVSSGNGNVTVTNTGVTSASAGNGISVSANTGGVTFTNTGVTSIVAGNNITISGSNGAVTINAQNAANGTVTSVGVLAGNGISVSGGPVTSSGNIVVTNTGVTSLVAGSGITLTGNTGNVTISSITTQSLINIKYGTEVVGLPTNLTGVYNYDIADSSVQLSTLTGNVTLNFRGNSTTTLNSIVSVGSSITGAFLVNQGAGTSQITGLQIDGVAQTIRYVSIPVAIPSTITSYTYTMIKTATNTWTVLGSWTRYT